MKPRFYILGDIHGQFDHLIYLIRNIRRLGGLNFKRGDILVQLGDRCDRGPDTYRINNFLKKLEKRYPGQVICLKGNHEDMMLNYAEGKDKHDLFIMNQGNATIKSYSDVSKIYGKKDQSFYLSLIKTGHYDWLRNQSLYYENDDYFFCHAPIPKESFRRNMIAKADFRQDKNTLIWSYEGESLHYWVDEDPTKQGKICVYGHIHGLYVEKVDEWSEEEQRMIQVSRIKVPGVREYGNAICIDGGCGCHPKGYLICLELPANIIYTSEELVK